MVDLDAIGEYVWKLLGCGKHKTSHRYLAINDTAGNATHKFCNNHIATAKYNLLTFIPKNIFEQFMRIANVYFFIVAILQLTTGLSPTGRFGTAVPLIIVMLFQALKDGIEDLKRHWSDRLVNNSKTRVIRNGMVVEIPWQQVRVGEICKVLRDEFFPADLIALSSSEPQGILYVETAQLDGETNLKIQNSLHHTHTYTTVEQLQEIAGQITCDHPNVVLSTFTGTVRFSGHEKEYGLTAKQQLLRGACLKNTGFIWGVVVYTGKDTKLMKNLRKPPHKRSKIEILTNYYIISLFIALALITAFCCITATIWTAVNEKTHWYMFPQIPGAYDGAVAVFFKGIISYFILFNNFIPISLYVSMELVKVFQSRLFIDKDLEMYHPPVDTAANCKTSSLNEELGQIDFIFSDKTGTLTQNKMEFLKFAVDGIEYGRGTTEIGRAVALQNGIKLVDDRPENWAPVDGFQFYDERVLDGAWAKQENKNNLFEFLMLLAVCHTVIPEFDKDDPSKIIYQASSPDEGALVKAAKQLGFSFCNRTHDTVTVRVCDKDHVFTVLNILEFNSTRKRFSIIVRYPDGRIVLFCKGADSHVCPRMKSGPHDQVTNSMLKKFAAEGLRTLVCAKLELDENTWSTWNTNVFEPANVALEKKEDKLMDAAEVIEKNMELVGATAIEDKLQDQVGNTISTLAEAGIKIWVLTGDKQETAINIGYACAMLSNTMHVIKLNEKNRGKLRNIILKEYENAITLKRDAPESEFGLVIEGDALLEILPAQNPTPEYKKNREKERKEFEHMEITFLRLCLLCKSVICCRVSPLQKSQIVKLVKENLKGSITLAIGDGANDVPMIQAAHIGVGISGEEGLQAARAADYSFAQFRFLKRLLLVHGRNNYRRISKLILFSFYKNAIVQMTQFWYIFFNAISGRTLYENTANALYNVTWTSLPIMALAVFDMDVPAEKAEKVPKLYTLGQKDYYFNLPNFLMWFANACWHSLCIFFIPYFCLGLATVKDGHPVDTEFFGLVLYTAIILVTAFKVVIETTTHNFLNIATIIFTFLVWPIFLAIYNVLVFIFPSRNWIINGNNTAFDAPYQDTRNALKYYYSVFFDSVPNPSLWLVLLLTVVVSLLRDIAWKSLYRLFRPQLYHVLQQVNVKTLSEDPKFLEQIYPQIKEMRGVVRAVPSIPSNYRKIMATETELVESSATTGKTEASSPEHRGYAFSQTEGGQKQLLAVVTGVDVPSPATPVKPRQQSASIVLIGSAQPSSPTIPVNDPLLLDENK